ncbi:hypothetical protein [Pseudomonas mangrovi]|uniref:hypothetical protein n=1 Tax=Pseudomonas mangrovi TaxID=2161748 RepID=UPI0011B27BB7|nr:hypothetical protein [Pseudomonas mangrovi]
MKKSRFFSMSCFGKGFFGALVVLAVAAFLVPQYADYAASAETSAWMAQVVSVQDHVAANAERNDSLVNSGLDAKQPNFSTRAPTYFEVTKDGTIFIQGGREGQLIVLVPALKEGKVSWRCIGGSRNATTRCNRNN